MGNSQTGWDLPRDARSDDHSSGGGGGSFQNWGGVPQHADITQRSHQHIGDLTHAKLYGKITLQQ